MVQRPADRRQMIRRRNGDCAGNNMARKEMVDVRGSTILLLLLMLTPSLPVESGQLTGHSLAFTHVTVIDGLGGPPKQEMTVIILEDRITAIGKSQDVRPAKGIRVVDAAGKFLI